MTLENLSGNENTKAFSAAVKDEIITQKISKRCCKRAFLAGAVRGAGNFFVSSEGYGIKVTHYDPELIAKCVVIVHSLTKCEPLVYRHVSNREVGFKTVYEFSLTGKDVFDKMAEEGILPSFGDFGADVPADLVSSECCKIHFIKGLFVACGTVSVPQTDSAKSSGGYYMDFSLPNETLADFVVRLLSGMGAAAKKRKRGGIYSVYIKEAETISDMFVRMGAVSAACELQNIMVYRMVKNNSNRYTNCESANIAKTVNASVRQTEAINKIVRAGLYDTLDEMSRQIVDVRLNNPDATLSMLSEILPSRPSRGAINHRLKKLIALGDSLED